jgi:ribokinase
MRIAVVGRIARDLVLVVPEVPDPGARAEVRERREVLGGKGANIARGARQLGATAALVGVVGDDRDGRLLVERLGADGVATAAVVRREATRTALIVDVVCGGAAGGLVVLDGAPDGRQAELLAAADVVRADHREAEALAGRRITGAEEAVRAGRELLARGPSVVALEVPGEGNVVVWDDDAAVIPLTDEDVVDTTGGGDAFVAALTVALMRGDPPPVAARLATTASGRAVGHPGGRTDLTGLA